MSLFSTATTPSWAVTISQLGCWSSHCSGLSVSALLAHSLLSTQAARRILLTHTFRSDHFSAHIPLIVPISLITEAKVLTMAPKDLHDLLPSPPTPTSPYFLPCSQGCSCTGLLPVPWTLRASFCLRAFALVVPSASYTLLPSICSSIKLYSSVPWPLMYNSNISQHFLLSFFYLDFFHALTIFW